MFYVRIMSQFELFIYIFVYLILLNNLCICVVFFIILETLIHDPKLLIGSVL